MVWIKAIKAIKVIFAFLAVSGSPLTWTTASTSPGRLGRRCYFVTIGYVVLGAESLASLRVVWIILSGSR